LQKAITEIKVSQPENKLEVLLVNLPWQKENRQGVRAGSRWPHLRDVSEGEYLPFPFFLAYATSLLKKNGINAYIIDAIAEKTSEEDFLEIVLRKDIDFIVAETSVPSFYDDLRLLKRIAEFGVSIILCGPNYEIFKPEFLKEHSFISFVLYGEYELTLLELIKALQQRGKLSDINGLIYNDDGIIKKNPPRTHFDLDILPWPQRETLPIYSYLDAPGGMRTPCAQILASRGCPFKCQFCLWPQVIYQGNHYRARDIKDVIDEMEYLVSYKGFKSVYFDDDTFNVGRKRMVDFCNEIRKRGLNKIQWSIMARADLMDEELLLNFKKAGLYSVKYGVESAVQSLVDGIGKDMDLKKTEKMIRFTQKLGIKVHLTFTFGLPGETRQTIQKTIDWAKSIDPFSVQFSILTPFPGTEYYKIMKEKGLIVSNDFSCYDGHSKSVIKLESLSSLDLESAKAYSYKAWEEHLRGRRNLASDVAKFFRYAKSNGFVTALLKVFSYFNKISLGEEHKQKAKKTGSSSNDIMLIQSPPWDIAMPPLGIAYLASNLKKLGYKVKVFDLNVALYNSAAKEHFLWEQKSFDWWVEEEYFVKTWEKIFEITNTLIDEALANAGTKIIGLSVNFAGIKFSSKLIKMIKHKNPNIKIIVGGWATCDKHMRSLLPTELIDCIIVGEGEETLPDAIKALTNGNSKDVLGAIFPKSNEEVFKLRPPIMNLDKISWPTFKEFNLSLYKYKILPLFTSRGCISQCAFCNDWPFSKPYRTRSASNIFDEIVYHVYKNNITKFSFKDLLCNGDLSGLRALCDLIERAKLRICWDSQAIARKEMTYEFLCKLKKSGCGSLIYGVESFSNNVLKRMGKIFTSEIIDEVLNNTHKAGIAALVNIIVGFPGESEEDFQETLEAVERNRKYLVKISAVSVCLINGRSDLDLNHRKYGLVLSEDLKIRAKHWESMDGTNTYNLRRSRVEKAIALFNKLGLTYETATI
ncbi:MAG: radical SAM protein, partial [Candidatus Omnitrophota bacterium]